MTTLDLNQIQLIKKTILGFQNKIQGLQFTKFGFIDDLIIGQTVGMLRNRNDTVIAGDIINVYNTPSWNILSHALINDSTSFGLLDHLRHVLCAILQPFLVNQMIGFIGNNVKKMTLVCIAAQEIVKEVNNIICPALPQMVIPVNIPPQYVQTYHL